MNRITQLYHYVSLKFMAMVSIACILVPLYSYSAGISEPSIQCTVLKVHKVKNIFGLNKFPKIYDSIDNNPLTSSLTIGGKKFKGIVPLVLVKTKKFEKILIQRGSEKITLELHGQPISRDGSLRVDGELLADITCH